MRMPSVHLLGSAHAQLISRKPGAAAAIGRKLRALQRSLGWPSLAACALTACSAQPEPATQPASDAGVETAEVTHCVAPAGTSASPPTIQDVIDLVNALPKPVSLPCLLETLQRPLRMHATRSTISAQPAVGRRSPRVFLFFDGLVVSVVPAGMGSALLELGEVRTELRTLKAELEFPVHETLPRDAPFKRILYQEGRTTCAFCHAAEVPDERTDFTQAFVSQALRPALQADRVSVAELGAELATCDDAAEPERCAMLKSLYGQGTPLDSEFPNTFQIFR